VKPKPFAQFVTFIYCENLEETCRFYEKIIGLKMVLDQRVCRIYQAAPNAFLGICRKTPPPQDKSAAILTFVSADVDGWYEHLKPHNLNFEKTPQYNPQYNIYHCFIRDPAGYLIEIQEFKDPAWPKPGGGGRSARGIKKEKS
jgi:catechol 2,3-dioxygenase-like lactoylglutathione lyase family enzyme